MSASKTKPLCLANRCQIKGCKFENNVKDSGLFKISRRIDVFEKWIQLSGKEELLELPLSTLRSSIYFCDLHFKDIQGGLVRKRLSAESLPTEFPDGHTPLCEETMARWRSSADYLEYWRCRGLLPSAQPAQPPLLRCPNLPENSPAMYCKTNGPFTCLYCEGKPLYSETSKSYDSDGNTYNPCGNQSLTLLSTPLSTSKSPTQLIICQGSSGNVNASKKAGGNISISYHRRRAPTSPLEKVEGTIPPHYISKSSEKVGIRLRPPQDLKPQTMMAVQLLKGQGSSPSACPVTANPLVKKAGADHAQSVIAFQDSPVIPSGSGVMSFKAKDLKSVSDDWEKEYVLTRIGDRLVAIPCLTSQIKKRKLKDGQE